MNDNQNSKILKSLADENRLRIIRILSYEELNVQEICEILQETQPKISRNLAILKNIGLIFDRRDGVKIYYSLQLNNPSYQHLESYINSLKDEQHEDFKKIKIALQKRTLESKKFSTKVASNWDALADLLHNPMINTLDIINFFTKNYTIVDLGCGTGALLPILAKISKKVYALDHSRKMLELAEEKAKHFALENIIFIQSDFIDNPKSIPQANIYILHHVLHQIASPNLLLKNLEKIINQNGIIIIIDLIAHNNEIIQNKFGSIWAGFTQKQILSWIVTTSFHISQWQEKYISNNDEKLKQFITIIKTK